MFKNALVSVSDKVGLADFIRDLNQYESVRLLSTGGTATYLRESGFQVIDIQEQTQFPEVMSGRVKTLHPYIHMGLLARDHVPEDLQLLKQYGLKPFDLVIGNLYPFQETLAAYSHPPPPPLSHQHRHQPHLHRELIEFIDIGGPSLLRAAAKSFERICAICDPKDYLWVTKRLKENGRLTMEDRKYLASKVFAHTSSYDACIAQTLQGENILQNENTTQDKHTSTNHNLSQPNYNLAQKGPSPVASSPSPFLENFSRTGELVCQLRYGENPQQKAAWYSCQISGLHNMKLLQGKALSYNNILDMDAAISMLMEFEGEPCCVSIKHNNPCGVGLGHHILEALESSLKADPISVFGGVVALNKRVGMEEAQNLTSLFLECIIAPDYTSEALEVFKKKKNLRILQGVPPKKKTQELSLRSIYGGFLVQSGDELESINAWEFLGDKPKPQTMETLILAWKVVMKLKSNAIAISRWKQTLGLGMGQVNRVHAVTQALGRMKEFHPEYSIEDVALASDAFFPFTDSIEVAAQAGIKWIIQPGGSMKDSEVLKKAEELGVNMVLTKTRHFLH